MKRAKFTLNHLFYPELSVDSNPDYDPNAAESPSEPTVKILLHKTDDDRYQVGMKLSLIGETPSDKYTIGAFCVANFTVDGDVPEDEQARLIMKSGPHIVFGALRDQIATVTSRGPWSEYYLQPKILEPEDFVPEDDPASMDVE
ncbi:hypothetical protein [Pseudomonas sp. DSP3-2-2]|uniref:hypothetical protein n=1 Tax=unclassified Pseudomonas TaxID=196821 RepID=UPI003CEDEF3B